MNLRTLSASVAAVLGCGVVAAAAQTSRVEVTAGYQTTSVPVQWLPAGWSADVAASLAASWGIVGEASGAYETEADEDLGDVHLTIHTFGAGPRWSMRPAGRIVPFLQGLIGAERASASAEILGRRVGESATRLLTQLGGGVNVKVTGRFGVVGQVDYRRVFYDDDEGGDSGENQFRAVAGVRIGF